MHRRGKGLASLLQLFWEHPLRRIFMTKNYIRASLLALTFGVATLGSAWAESSQSPQDTSPSAQQPSQTQPSQSQPSEAQPGQSQPSSTPGAQPSSTPGSKEFMGTIVKDNGAFVLKDSSGSVSYKVDDESKVKDYEGKQVKVMGTLDSSSNTIHVDSIQVIS
jgi:hypothetical protein